MAPAEAPNPSARAAPARKKGGLRKWLAPPFALGLLAWVLWKYDGLRILGQVFDKIGWRWPLLVLPWAMIALITILAYRNALPARGKAIPFWILVQIERAGSALNSILPLGNNSSHIIKVDLLRHWFPSEGIVAAGVWCALASGNANIFGAIGPLVSLPFGVGETWVVAALAGTAIAMSLPTLTILLLVRRGLAERVAKLLGKLPFDFVKRRHERLSAWAQRLDKHMAAALGERRADYLRLLGYRFLGQTVRIGEIWLVVELLELPGGIFTAVFYNASSRAVEQLTPFIPGRIGVMEGAQAAVFAALGLTGEAGLAIALTLRFRYVLNLVVSFLFLTRFGALSQKYPPRQHAKPGDATAPIPS